MHIVLLHRKQFVVKLILRFTCFYIYPIECPQCVSAHLCRTLLAMITTTLLCWLFTFSTATSQWSQTCLRRQQSLRLAAVGNVQYLFWMSVNTVSTTLPTSPFLPHLPRHLPRHLPPTVSALVQLLTTPSSIAIQKLVEERVALFRQICLHDLDVAHMRKLELILEQMTK